MLPIPKWAQKYLKFRECPYCEQPTTLRGVTGLGVREQRDDETGAVNYVLTIEYVCCACEKKSVFLGQPEDGANHLDVVESILEALVRNESSQKSLPSKGNGSKISKKEVENLLKVLNEAQSFDEVLKYIGAKNEPLEQDDEETTNQDQ